MPHPRGAIGEPTVGVSRRGPRLSVPNRIEFGLIDQSQPAAVRLPANDLRPGAGAVPIHDIDIPAVLALI